MKKYCSHCGNVKTAASINQLYGEVGDIVKAVDKALKTINSFDSHSKDDYKNFITRLNDMKKTMSNMQHELN